MKTEQEKIFEDVYEQLALQVGTLLAKERHTPFIIIDALRATLMVALDANGVPKDLRKKVTLDCIACLNWLEKQQQENEND